MARFYYFVIGICGLLLGSCAQVGSIAGGANDVQPPKIIDNGLKPASGSVNFSHKFIEMNFNEFVKLNNPVENILLVPPHAKINATANRKKVTLEIDGELQPETTYAIYLNGAIEDLTEGNDSLMQYVFSTGNAIDTLTYTGFVADAFSYKPLKGMLVGLFETTDSALTQKPLYFTTTDADGKFVLNYLKEGNYQLLAFEDKNKDLKIQPSERFAFKSDEVELQNSMTDSSALRMFQPQQKRRIRATFVPPGLLLVGSNESLENFSFSINSSPIEVNQRFQSDSLGFLIDFPTSNKLELIASSVGFQDTISVRISEKDKLKSPTMETNLTNGFLFPSQALTLRFSDEVVSIDSSLIELINSDSLKLSFSLKKISKNELQLLIEPNDSKDLKLNFLKKSIMFKNYNELISFNLNFKSKKIEELGVVLLNIESVDSSAFIEVLKGNKVVFTIPARRSSNLIRIENLEPDTYTFRAILDSNSNGRWDVGNKAFHEQPEAILFFSNGVKVRANWEIEATLIPMSNGK